MLLKNKQKEMKKMQVQQDYLDVVAKAEEAKLKTKIEIEQKRDKNL